MVGAESLGESLSRFYEVFPWPEDPLSPEGRARYEAALSFFRGLLEHEWLTGIAGKRRLSVVDVCSGAGLGGVALAKAFTERGLEVELVLVDLRREALELARRFSEAELGSPAETYVLDARELHALGRRFDVALVYGLTTPHFDAFDAARVYSSIAESLADDGVLLVEENDRFYGLIVLGGYREVFYEGDERRGALSVQVGYDSLRGVVRRMHVDLSTGKRAVGETRYWDLAGTLALVWLFFEDVDFARYPGKPRTGIVIAKKPRRKLRPDELGLPTVLRKLQAQ
ncbi:class I SAM-dependent methyltransferase [Thermofilum pendens]|uniref:Methyltransferase type 12 n=1 Tax=Thermofilum pendens (strain DSM 2475 / Hrk 5) TaxID=368408 RepID=A1S003_THEPD|nr:class I SAM-dependent methyltransferase [Thermofilum pendens]ABL78783.1 Methyltransferase type 12 [Thermofilum pendens Hrk 5]